MESVTQTVFGINLQAGMEFVENAVHGTHTYRVLADAELQRAGSDACVFEAVKLAPSGHVGHRPVIRQCHRLSKFKVVVK